MFIKIICIIMEIALIPATALIFATAMSYGDLRKLGRKKYDRSNNEANRKVIRKRMEIAMLNEIGFYCIGLVGIVAMLNNLLNNILG